MKRILHKHPWLFVVLAFTLLISAWSSLIVIALKNQPASIAPTAISTDQENTVSIPASPQSDDSD